MRILIQYRPNPDYYDSDTTGFFYDDYVFNFDRLEKFVEYVRDSDEHIYSGREAEAIYAAAVAGRNYAQFEFHDKYTFYDTDWERKLVLDPDQESVTDLEFTVYLNS